MGWIWTSLVALCTTQSLAVADTHKASCPGGVPNPNAQVESRPNQAKTNISKAIFNAPTAKEKLKLLYWWDRSLLPAYPAVSGIRKADARTNRTMRSAGQLITDMLEFVSPANRKRDPQEPPPSKVTLFKHLHSLLRDRDHQVRAVARIMLESRGDEELTLVAKLHGSTRTSVLAAFGKVQSKHKLALSMLHQFYSDSDVELRLAAMDVVSRLKLQGYDTPKFLLHSLESDDERLRSEAASRILRKGLAKRMIVNKLMPALGARNPSRLATVCRSLGLLGKHSTRATKRLKELLRHENERVRLRAVGALVRINGPAPGHVAVLAELLKSRVAKRRLEAVQMLRVHGKRARPATAALVNAAFDSDERVAKAASDLLKVLEADE